MLRRPRAAREAEERLLADPFEQARLRVAAGHFPGCVHRAIDALAERHRRLGKGLRDKPVIIAYGNRGDRRRTEAAERARAAGQPESGPGLAEMMRMSRRSAQRAIKALLGAGELECERGGGEVPRRSRADRHGEVRMHVMGRGGAGWANAFYVRGIPRPAPPTKPAPPTPPEPDPEPPPRPAGWRAVKDRFDRDRLERRREVTRGP